MTRQPIRVVVADDSLVAREMLREILDSDPDIEVVGVATDGQEAVDLVASLRPDIVTMDIHMPRMDGLEATERIMAYTPTPILVVSSSVHGPGMGRAFDALSSGALEVIKKPEPSDWQDLQTMGRTIIRTVRVLSRVKVITHLRGKHKPGEVREAARRAQHEESPGGRVIVAVGSSTGGPSALLAVLGKLPASFPVPIVVAQHIAEGFIPGLVSWLGAGCRMKVRAADDGDTVTPGTVYFAPTGRNLEMDGMVTRYASPRPGQLYIPSADTLFASVARSYGSRSVGVILTGMGADGAEGLHSMRDAGAATIAQDEESSTVFGMPKAAIDNGAAAKVLPVSSIADEVQRLVMGVS